MTDRPPAEELAWLRSREGYEPEVYLDSRDKPTAGVGHLLQGEEAAQYPVGSKVDELRSDLWLADDSQWAWEAAKEQAKEIDRPELASALLHINFQLGPNWRKIHKNTWKKLKAGDLEGVAKEIENSKWHEQTPKRTRDFQASLRGQPRQEEYDS